MSLTIETRSPCEGVAVIALSGDMDIYTAPRLKQQVTHLLDRGIVNLLVDVTDLEYVDSTALGVLIGCLRRTREHTGHLRLICDNPRIDNILQISGLTKVFDLYRSESEALAAADAYPK